MRKCVDCHAEVDDRAYVCPNCGSKTLVGAYAAENADAAVEIVKNQLAAKEHVDRSARLYFEGRLDEAILALRTALAFSPLNPAAHGNMGAILMEQGKPGEAIPWF